MLSTLLVLTDTGPFLIPSAQGIAFSLFSTGEHHMTASDQENVSRSSNSDSLMNVVFP